MDRLRGHYPKWNKSARERQILYDITVESKKHNKWTNVTKTTHWYREQTPAKRGNRGGARYG